MYQLTSFVPTTANITYLIVGIVLATLSVFLIWLSYWTAMNKPDPNYLENHNWFTKWIIKNRMTFCICVTVIIILISITLILLSLGVFMSTTNPL